MPQKVVGSCRERSGFGVARSLVVVVVVGSFANAEIVGGVFARRFLNAEIAARLIACKFLGVGGIRSFLSGGVVVGAGSARGLGGWAFWKA